MDVNYKFIDFIKLILFRVIGMMIPIMCFLIYLGINDSVNDFINYAIKGVREFTNNIPYYRVLDSADRGISFLSRLIIIVYVPLCISFILEFIKNKKMSNELISIYVIMFFAIPIIAILYPISDEFHLMPASVFALIIVAYLLNYFLKEISKYVKIDVFCKELVCIGFLAIILIISFKNAILARKNNIKESVLIPYKQYKNIFVPEYLRDRMADVTEKIKVYENSGAESIVIDAEAAIYDIILNKYKKNYDMLLIGNIGENGSKKIIDEIKNSHNVYYFIKSPQYALNWQLPLNIVEYIRNNLKYHETVSSYDVYYKE